MSSPGGPSTPSATPSPVTMPTSSTQPATSSSSSSAPTTNARGAARRPPKLRSSCDACGAAKVRCDKTQPRCGRCAAGGITCVYGLSRKFGKAPRKKAPSETGAAGDAASKSLAQNAQNAHQSSLPCFPDYHPLPGGTARAVKYEPRSATSPGFGLEDSLMAFTTSQTGHDVFMPSPDSTGMDGFSDPFSFADAPHGHGAILRADPRHHATVDPLDLTFSASDYPTFSDWIHPDDLMHTPESQPAGDADSAHHMPQPPHRLPASFSSSSSLSSSSSSPPSLGPARLPDASLVQAGGPDCPHHCPRLARATLDSLSPGHDAARGEQHLTQTMDKVLNRNKQAVDNMRQLLACPCSRSPHLAMLYASITSRILTWYQLAAGCAKPPAAATAATAATTWDTFPTLGSHQHHHAHAHAHHRHQHHRRNQPTPPLSASSSPAASSATPAASPVGTTTAPTAAAVAALGAQAQSQAHHHKGVVGGGGGGGGGFVVTPMQFSAGAFSVDDEAAQEALRAQLLLSELRKAGSLIDLLCLQGGGGGGPRAGDTAAAPGGGGGDGGGGEVNNVDIYSALGAWLRCELNRTVASLQS